MKTKFFFVLFIVALFAAACAPVIAGNISPKDPAQPAIQENVALMPVTGASASVSTRDSQDPRLWSGAISLSDTDNPDYVQNSPAPALQNEQQNACMSEDSLLKRQSGCIE